MAFANSSLLTFISNAEGEEYALLWKQDSKEPERLLELSSSERVISVSLNHLVGDYYVALVVYETQVDIFLVSLSKKKSSKKKVVKPDCVINLTESHHAQLLTANFKNDSEVHLVIGNLYAVY